MKSCRILIAALTMVGLATTPACEHRPTTTTAPTTTSQLIEQAESGSESALEQLEALSASSELAQHSDAIGQAATRIAQATTNRFEEEDPLVIRWQQLFFDTDPIANANEDTRREFAKSNVRLGLIAPIAIDPGVAHDIGVTDRVALRDATLYFTRRLKLSISYDNFFVNDVNIFEGASHSSNADIHPTGIMSTGHVNYKRLLVDAQSAPPLGTPISLRCEVKVRLMDHNVIPPAIFAEWTEELTIDSRIAGG